MLRVFNNTARYVDQGGNKVRIALYLMDCNDAWCNFVLAAASMLWHFLISGRTFGLRKPVLILLEVSVGRHCWLVTVRASGLHKRFSFCEPRPILGNLGKEGLFKQKKIKHTHKTVLQPFLWPPCVADEDIIFSSCGFFFLSIFFPCLISAIADWMSTMLPHMVWP